MRGLGTVVNSGTALCDELQKRRPAPEISFFFRKVAFKSLEATRTHITVACARRRVPGMAGSAHAHTQVRTPYDCYPASTSTRPPPPLRLRVYTCCVRVCPVISGLGLWSPGRLSGRICGVVCVFYCPHICRILRLLLLLGASCLVY